MAVNRLIQHLYIIPEDDANRQMAIGFERDDRVRPRAIQIVAPAGGWMKALERLKKDYFDLLRKNRKTHVMVLIDCDDEADRIKDALANVPTELKDRVFILGTLNEPEVLKKSLSIPLEEIGALVAEECFDGDRGFWQHHQLHHNSEELSRIEQALYHIVFKTDRR
jgi:hypothetical protein